MSRKNFWSFLSILVLCSFVEIRSDITGPTGPAGNLTDSGRFVPPPPPLFPAILYPINAATGILVAIAVPVPLHDQSVFVSYNFEMNYNMPNIPSDSILGPLTRVSSEILC